MDVVSADAEFVQHLVENLVFYAGVANVAVLAVLSHSLIALVAHLAVPH